MGTTRLEPHRRAILGMVGAAWLAVAGSAFVASPFAITGLERSAYPSLGDFALRFLLVGVRFSPFLGLALVTVRALLGALSSRAKGEALDRRPFHLATASGAAAFFAALAWFRANELAGVVAALVTIVCFVFAARDWTRLFALLSSRTLVEHPEVRADVPRIVEAIERPVTLFAPPAAAYRTEAKGAPFIVVPSDRNIARRALVNQMLVTLAVMIAAACTLGPLATRSHCERAQGTGLEGSRWRGDIDFGAKKDNFRLDIEVARNGELKGVMDWGDVAANVEGTYDGTTLVFYDRSIRRTNGAPFVLNDRKDVTLVGHDEMVGTDKAGRVRLHAVRVR